MAVAALAAGSGLVGCGDGANGSVAPTPAPAPASRIGPLTPTDPDRIPPEQRTAIAALAASASHDPPDPHAMHRGHADGGPATTVVLADTDDTTFAQQWAAAVA